MDENERTSQTLHVTYGNSNVLKCMSEIVFHAVYIPEENVNSSIENNTKGKYIKIKIIFLSFSISQSRNLNKANNSYLIIVENIRVYQDKAEALKVIKEFKTGRLKSFKKRSEAEEYAKTGFEKANYVNSTSICSTVPVIEEKSNNFKAPRSQELVCFRKLIKDGDLYAIKTTVWSNPRYLVGSGDTPAILQVRQQFIIIFMLSYCIVLSLLFCIVLIIGRMPL